MKRLLVLFLSVILLFSLAGCDTDDTITVDTSCKSHFCTEYELEKMPTETEKGILTGMCALTNCGAKVDLVLELIKITPDNVMDYFEITYEQIGTTIEISCLPKEAIKTINAISLKEPITYYSLLTSSDIKPVIVGFTAHVTKYEPNGEIHSTYDRTTSIEYDIKNPPEYYLLPNATIYMGKSQGPTINNGNDDYTYTFTMEYFVGNGNLIVIKSND